MAEHIHLADGIDKIEKLQEHPETDIYNKANKIIQKYFNGEEEEESGIAPSMDSNQYHFGQQQQPGQGFGGNQQNFNFTGFNS